MQTSFRALGPLLAVGLLGACSGVRVESSGDLPPEAAGSLTYAWAPDAGGSAIEPELAQQIRDEVDADLAARGLAVPAAQDAEPDLLVTPAVDVGMRVRVNDPYYFFPLLQQIEEGRLALTFTDPRTGELRWQGTGRRELRTVARSADSLSSRLVPTTEERDWDVPETVQAILAEFPAPPP
jgi:hypothetical protein